MNHSNFIRLSGWLMILGAVVFYSFWLLYYLNDNGYIVDSVMPDWGIAYDLSTYGSPILLAVGVLGLRARYGESVGNLGKTILLISPLGILISYYGLTQASIYDQAPLVLGAGHLVLHICLTLFGVMALIKKPLPRWNALPLVAGIWVPAFVLFVVVSGLPIEQIWAKVIPWFVLTVTIQSAAFLVLGYILQADAPQEMAPV